MLPHKHKIDRTDKKTRSDHLESVCKDVECMCRTLKQQFVVLKNRMCLHNKEDVDRMFVACCILHNMPHHWDGFDDWKNVEEQAQLLQEAFGSLE